jgi:hypothetical protein
MTEEFLEEVTTKTNTLDIFRNSRTLNKKHNLDSYHIVDVYAHHVETDSWPEIIEHVHDPVLRDYGDS